MSEKPILFSGPLVRAILEGRKTQTRRVVKSRRHGIPSGIERRGDRWVLRFDGEPTIYEDRPSPFGKPGDRLWVRETWAIGTGVKGDRKAALKYAADNKIRTVEHEGVLKYPPMLSYGERWRPSIHMPRWACRMTLRVTSVGVERLQDISLCSAWEEGARCGCMAPVPMCAGNVDAFARLWDSIAKPGEKWADNPWVWAVSFEREEPDHD